jgi:membrane protease YdiL (CAAX protease family)
MSTTTSEIKLGHEKHSPLWTLSIIVATAAFCGFFLLFDQAYNRFISPGFSDVGTSAWTATLYGLVSRAHLIIPLFLLVLWRPRLLGFQMGKTRQYWRMLLVMLLANCGIVAGYLWLTGRGTPYSGNEWLVTEVVIVPLVEETFWRGLVFVAFLGAFRLLYSENAAIHSAVWVSGLAFGALHIGNALAGVSPVFVAIQVLNAAVWGIVYGYARAKTESIYPPIFLHAAMNLVVVLF